MESVEIALANSLDEIPGLAEAVEAFGETHDLPPKLVFQLNLALEELVTNIVCHAGRLLALVRRRQELSEIWGLESKAPWQK